MCTPSLVVLDDPCSPKVTSSRSPSGLGRWNDASFLMSTISAFMTSEEHLGCDFGVGGTRLLGLVLQFHNRPCLLSAGLRGCLRPSGNASGYYVNGPCDVPRGILPWELLPSWLSVRVVSSVAISETSIDWPHIHPPLFEWGSYSKNCLSFLDAPVAFEASTSSIAMYLAERSINSSIDEGGFLNSGNRKTRPLRRNRPTRYWLILPSSSLFSYCSAFGTRFYSRVLYPGEYWQASRIVFLLVPFPLAFGLSPFPIQLSYGFLSVLLAAITANRAAVLSVSPPFDVPSFPRTTDSGGCSGVFFFAWALRASHIFHKVFGSTAYNTITFPLDPICRRRTRTRIHILSIIQSIQRKVPTPFQPPSLVYQTVKKSLHHHCSRIFLPWPSKICLYRVLNCFQIRGCNNLTIVNGNSSVLVRIGPTLSSYCVHFVGRVSRENVTILENHCSISKDEVHCAINVTFPVELSLRMNVQSVLNIYSLTNCGGAEGCGASSNTFASAFTYITYLPLLLFVAPFMAALKVVYLPDPSFATTTLAREAGEDACNNFLSPGLTHQLGNIVGHQWQDIVLNPEIVEPGFAGLEVGESSAEPCLSISLGAVGVRIYGFVESLNGLVVKLNAISPCSLLTWVPTFGS
ncbi:hypothetical protein G2W53_001728 [Senna tora]|uniref:Uncharacterized protein n=1 Tax=Senna tora TaxID=362788 RepID=A0A834XGB8_9FABA|nr:hypothetical protein G2W53_001728 [Senna tora]